ncbi:hypothetical protein DFS34DRAFT_671806, partial [Phlyctochytrium arcticum]
WLRCPTPLPPPPPSAGYEKPSASHSIRWTNFWVSKEKNEKSRRRHAMCKSCSTVIRAACSFLLFVHIGNNCNMISDDLRIQYKQAVIKAELPRPQGSQADHDSDATSLADTSVTGTSPATVKKRCLGNNSTSVAPFFTPMSKPRTNELHVTMLQSIITSNTPFACLENRYFRKYQQMLVGNLYNLPSREKLISDQLPVLHAQYKLDIQALLDKEAYLTLSLDGWTNISGNSIHALMLVKGECFKIFLDVL